MLANDASTLWWPDVKTAHTAPTTICRYHPTKESLLGKLYKDLATRYTCVGVALLAEWSPDDIKLRIHHALTLGLAEHAVATHKLDVRPEAWREILYQSGKRSVMSIEPIRKFDAAVKRVKVAEDGKAEADEGELDE